MKSVLVALLIALSLCGSAPVHAQLRYILMPQCGDDSSVLTAELRLAPPPDYVLSAGAVAGEALTPVLRQLSKPGQPVFTVAGAAQVALARLGDKTALEELKKELETNSLAHSPEIFETISKLAAVRSDTSVSILMQYLIQNANNPKRKFDYGDAGDDPMVHVITVLISMLEDPPFQGTEHPAPYYESQLEGWGKWWENTKAPRLTPIYQDIRDPKPQCLVKLAEWGEADAVSGLYRYSGQVNLPVIRRLARLGDKLHPSAWNTVPGRAQTILAQAGDADQFARIAKELESVIYADGIEKLQHVASKQAFETLLNALDLTTFMSGEGGHELNFITADGAKHNYRTYQGQQLRENIMAALFEMVVNPPLPPNAPATDANMQIWREWWQANKDKDVLRKTSF